jgi:hypothetical protein
MTFEWKKIISIFSFTLFLTGCAASSAPVKKAPLSSSKQSELRSKLIGKWKQTYRKESRNGTRKPLKYTIKKWTFNEDGTGEIIAGAKNPVTGKTVNSNTFSWHLEGRNLALGEPGNETIKFRIDQWDDNQMTWFNYPSSSFYIVEKTE